MSQTPSDVLPLTDTVAVPGRTGGRLAAVHVRQAYADGTAIYPIGGRHEFGLRLAAATIGLGRVARAAGSGCRLSGSGYDDHRRGRNSHVGIGRRFGHAAAAIADRCAASRSGDAGGSDRHEFFRAVALRPGHDSRLSVIGISAVDGRGMAFKGGGRVVKNVAGYDFCKLLVGSFGTLGIISQVTLKVKPIPEVTALVACRLRDHQQAEQLLAALVTSRTAPAAIEILVGMAWRDEPALEQVELGQDGKPFGHLIVAARRYFGGSGMDDCDAR